MGARSFLSALEPARRPAWSKRTELDAELDACAAAARQAHGLEPQPELLAAALARVAPDCDPREDAPFASLAVGDLYLAFACGRGDAGALRRFDVAYGPELDRAIARSPKLGATASEFRQLVAVRLFVAREPGEPPKIASYVGRGSLKAWLRVTAARLIIDLSRKPVRADGSADDALIERMDDGRDTELDYLRRTYGPQLQAAFEHAVAALTVRQRNLLRQRYLHEVSAGALAKLYGVHRSTLFVWLEQARAALLQHAREQLAQAVPGHALESVVGVLGSRLQVSVRRVLDSRLESEMDS